MHIRNVPAKLTAWVSHKCQLVRVTTRGWFPLELDKPFAVQILIIIGLLLIDRRFAVISQLGSRKPSAKEAWYGT